MTRATWLMTLAAVCVATPAWGDTILLKDGRQYEGELVRRENQLILQKTEGGFFPIREGDIQKTIRSSPARTATSSDAEWARVQAFVRRSDDLAQIVAAYEKFLADFPDAPSGAMAKVTLEEYRSMQKGQYVKVRGRWVPQAQLDVTSRAAEEKARPALEHYRAGRLKEAVSAAKEALRSDGENVTALAVAGLASYRLDALPAAREYFTKLTEVDPSNALGWNNLAVISFLQKREPEALLHYTKALGAATQNRQVLDNIMDAMSRYSGSKTVVAYTNLEGQVKAPEEAMEVKLAESGLVRVGSAWATKAQRDRQVALGASLQAQGGQRVLELGEVDNPPAPAAVDWPEMPVGVALGGPNAGVEAGWVVPSVQVAMVPGVTGPQSQDVVPVDPRSSRVPGYPLLVPGRNYPRMPSCMGHRGGMWTYVPPNYHPCNTLSTSAGVGPRPVVGAAASRQAMMAGQRMWNMTQNTRAR